MSVFSASKMARNRFNDLFSRLSDHWSSEYRNADSPLSNASDMKSILPMIFLRTSALVTM